MRNTETNIDWPGDREVTDTHSDSEKKVNVGTGERIVSTVSGSALLAYGIQRKDWLGALLGVVGAGLALRGTTGQCPAYKALDIDTSDESIFSTLGEKVGLLGTKAGNWFNQTVKVVKSVSINKSPEELYAFWRNFENLPIFMNHLEAVEKIDETHSKWTAKAPLGTEVTWTAEVIEDMPNQRISWASYDNSQIPNMGSVEFIPTVNHGTEVKVTIKYEPPAGKLGAIAAYFLQEEPETQVTEDLRRFKRLMETGVIMKTEGQPKGGQAPKVKTARA
jgi:uncharacterized membrane protein